MTALKNGWPRKTRELHNHHMDSTVWNEFEFRRGDIVIATWAKSGTTWLQQIVGQLIFEGAEGVPVTEISPWLDLRALPRQETLAALEAQEHRRFIKTHLPVDALVISPQAKYIYIGRDGRDALWSMYNHHASASQAWYDALNLTPGLVGLPIERPPADAREYFHDWLDGDGFPFWPYWSNVQSWWNIRGLPNVALVHFENLKRDLAGEVRRIAEFLEIDVAPWLWHRIVEHCSFDYMKEHAAEVAPMAEIFFQGGAKTFINKGTNRRWRDVLTHEDVEKYEAEAARNLTLDCAHWLATGEL